MNIHRLKVLRDFLLTAPIEDQFNMENWVSDRNNSEVAWCGEAKITCNWEQLRCSERFSIVPMVACACGFAATIPEFVKDGFFLHNPTDGYENYENYEDFDAAICVAYNAPDRYLYEGYEAVCKFFEINHREADYLFTEGFYSMEDRKSPKAVANRIDQFIVTEGLIGQLSTEDENDIDQ